MSDLISRQAAIDALRDEENHAFNSYYKGLIKAHEIIANLPPVTPQPKTGHWIEEKIENTKSMFNGCVKDRYCNICKTHSATRTNYCPNCGADMREVEE